MSQKMGRAMTDITTSHVLGESCGDPSCVRIECQPAAEGYAPCTGGCGKMMPDGYPGQKYTACPSCRRKMALVQAQAQRERKAAQPFLRRTPR